MLIQHAIWKVGAKPEPLTASKPATEKSLEDMICNVPSFCPGVDVDWSVGENPIRGHQRLVGHRADGSLVLIGLKWDKTPREIAEWEAVL